MKKFLLLFLCFTTLQLWAQIPNADFETWSGGNPIDWFTTNFPGIIVNVTQSTEAYSGSSSIKGEVVASINPSNPPYAPMIMLGADGDGAAVNQRYTSVKGYYKMISAEGDRLVSNIWLVNSNLIIAAGTATLDVKNEWTAFEIPFGYLDSSTPDVCKLQFFVEGPSNGADPHVGSYFLLDGLSFGSSTTSVEDEKSVVKEFALNQNYPNPFNPSTTIEFSISQSNFVSLKVFNLLGKEVATLVNETKDAGVYQVKFDGSGLSSGIYFYTLRSGKNVITKKLMLNK